MLWPRRTLVVAIAAFLAAAACGGGGKKNNSGGQYGSPLLDPTTSEAPPATTHVTLANGAVAARAAGKPAPITTPTVAKPPDKTSDPVVAASKGQAGDFAGMLLSASSPVKKIVYELMEQEGLAPARSTLDHVVANWKKYSGKEIDVETTPIPPGPTHWTTDQLATYAERYTRFKSGGDTAVIHVEFVHGELGGAAGVAYQADKEVMLPDTYSSGGGTPGTSGPELEDVVVTHETGHIMGLIDLWLNDGRGDYKDDPAPGGHHSPNQDSVMYWRVETLSVKTFFRGGPPHEYDAADQKDLMAIHNGAAKGSKVQ